MIKVIHIKEDLRGGTENYCHGLYDILHGDPDVCILPVPHIPQKASRFFHYAYDEKVLQSYIAEADIVHINGYLAQGNIDAIRIAHKMGKKIVYTAHFHPFKYIGHPLLGKLFFYLRMKPLIQKYADVVTTINNEDTAFFNTFHHRVVQIPHWNRCMPDSDTKHIHRNHRMILFVGRINDHVKNFQQLLALDENRYEIHCISKDGYQTDRQDIILHKNVSDAELNKLYRQASLLVVPSKYEAFAFVALEALSVGTPVVMSDRVRIADYLEGIAGYSIYKYGQNADFKQKVANTIGTSVDTVEIQKRFSPNVISRMYKDLYMSV